MEWLECGDKKWGLTTLGALSKKTFPMPDVLHYCAESGSVLHGRHLGQTAEKNFTHLKDLIVRVSFKNVLTILAIACSGGQAVNRHCGTNTMVERQLIKPTLLVN